MEFAFSLAIKTGLTLVGFAALLTVVLYFGQRQLLYFPDARAPSAGILQAAGFAPAKARTEDGLELTYWIVKPAKPDNFTVVLFHGNAGNAGDRWFLAEPFVAAGYGFVLASYRGYSGNPGMPEEQGLYADGRAVLEQLAQNGIAPETLVLWGESLGSGVATKLASERKVAAVVLQAPFTSVADRAAEMFFYLVTRPFVRDRFENLARIGQIGAPLLIVHGEADRIVPVSHGRRLFEAAAEPKRAVFLPAPAEHNNLFNHGLTERILEFLAALDG